MRPITVLRESICQLLEFTASDWGSTTFSCAGRLISCFELHAPELVAMFTRHERAHSCHWYRYLRFGRFFTHFWLVESDSGFKWGGWRQPKVRLHECSRLRFMTIHLLVSLASHLGSNVLVEGRDLCCRKNMRACTYCIGDAGRLEGSLQPWKCTCIGGEHMHTNYAMPRSVISLATLWRPTVADYFSWLSCQPSNIREGKVV